MSVNGYRRQAEEGKRWCYDCQSYYQMGGFGGYMACQCRIHGSLDVDQRERHPDHTADSCPDYKQKDGPLWFEKYTDL